MLPGAQKAWRRCIRWLTSLVGEEVSDADAPDGQDALVPEERLGLREQRFGLAQVHLHVGHVGRVREELPGLHDGQRLDVGEEDLGLGQARVEVPLGGEARPEIEHSACAPRRPSADPRG